MKMQIQVIDEQKRSIVDWHITDVPEDMYRAPDSSAVTLDGVKTAISYHQFLKKEVDEAAER